MSSCITGREVVIVLRERRTNEPRTCSVICPGSWSKERLLAYCRKEHPDETVVIKEWKVVYRDDQPWSTRLWMVNPKEMIDDFSR